MSQTIEYNPQKELWQYKPDIIIQNVPITIFNNDKDANDYYQHIKSGRKWKSGIEKLNNDFDKRMLGDFFYCLDCERLEDGAHRRIIAKEKGIKTINVRTGNTCYKNYVKNGRFIRSDSTFLNTLIELIEKNPKRHKLDKKWLYASAFDKWPFIIKHVDFRDKSFLDVGCNIGYSCFRAWSLMSYFVVGIDIRKDAINIANLINKKLSNGENEIFFDVKCLLEKTKLEIEYQDYKERYVYDIVMCMGLLHYFKMFDYEAALNNLIESCSETLIIELRLKQNNKEIKLTKGSGNQTLPTEGWLFRKLENNNFTVKARLNRGKDRELWIAERKNKMQWRKGGNCGN